MYTLWCSESLYMLICSKSAVANLQRREVRGRIEALTHTIARHGSETHLIQKQVKMSCSCKSFSIAPVRDVILWPITEALENDLL